MSIEWHVGMECEGCVRMGKDWRYIYFNFRYDPDTNKWTFVQSMHVCRGGVGLSSLGGYLFAIGGHDGKSYLQTAEVFCPRTNKWSMVASMKTSRAGAGVVSCPLSTLLNLNSEASSSTFSIPDSLGSL